MITESQQNFNIKEGNEISLKELILKIQEWWRYLLSRWLIILVFGLIGGVLGFYYAYSKKPVYIATTTFVLEEGDKAMGIGGGLGGLASMAGIDLGGGGGGIFQGDNILQLYKSRKMIEKTLFTNVNIGGKSQLLINYFIQFNKLHDNWKKEQKLRNVSFDEQTFLSGKFTRMQDSIITSIALDLNKNYLTVVKPDKKLSIIQANVKSLNESFAKTFNEAIVKNVNDFYVQTKTKKSLANVNILQDKTDSVRNIMNGAIYTAASVVDATPNLNPTRQVQRVAPAQKAQFSAETNKAVLSSLVQNLELSKLTLLKEAPLIQVVDTPVYPLLVEKASKRNWIIIGGFLAGLLSVFYLVGKKMLKNL